jgi:hypothetical protein
MNFELNNFSLDIYLSYPELNENILLLFNVILNNNINIINKSFFINNTKEINAEEIEYILYKLINNSKYIFICLSQYSIKNFSQILELNEIERNKKSNNKKKIIYLLLEIPKENSLLEFVISDKEIDKELFPLYNKITTNETIQKLLLLNYEK